MDEFQKQSRANRKSARPHVEFWEKSKHGGAHEDKVGKNAPRQRQKLTKRDIERSFDDQDDLDYSY